MATPQPDLLNPTTPKKKPTVPDASPGLTGPLAQGPETAAVTAMDTGVPPPAAAPQQGGVETVPAPATTPVPAPAPAPAGVSPQQGIAQLNQTMQSRFNRALTPQEIQGLGQAIGAPAGPGGTYTPQQLAQAQDYVDRYSGDINNPFPVTPAAPAPAPAPAGPAPAGFVTVDAAQQQINAAMVARVGHPLTPQEQAGLAQAIGPPQGPNGTYSQAQLDQALDLVSRYSGNLDDPYGALPESAPGSTTSLANRRLTELLSLDYGEVDPNSQAIQQPLGAFRSAQSRAVDRAKIANALRTQREGTSGGAEEAALMGLLEEQGQNEAGFEANLYASELIAQRKQLSEAIQLATQAGLQNKARELQEKLGTLDIDLRRYLGQGQLALGAQQLSQQDRQFLESMGFNYANLAANANARAIEAAI